MTTRSYDCNQNITRCPVNLDRNICVGRFKQIGILRKKSMHVARGIGEKDTQCCKTITTATIEMKCAKCAQLEERFNLFLVFRQNGETHKIEFSKNFGIVCQNRGFQDRIECNAHHVDLDVGIAGECVDREGSLVLLFVEDGHDTLHKLDKISFLHILRGVV